MTNPSVAIQYSSYRPTKSKRRGCKYCSRNICFVIACAQPTSSQQPRFVTSYNAWEATITRCTGYAHTYALKGRLFGSRYVVVHRRFKIHSKQCDTAAQRDRGSQAGCPAVWSAKDAVLCRHECESVPPDPFSPLLCWLSDAPQFLLDSIERQHDSYLSELKDMLLRIRGKEASTQTIERTLKRAGFTLKEVCISGHLW